MTTRWARVARGVVAAVVSLFVAASFHIVAGGNTPTLLALTACLVISTFVCVALAGKKLSLLQLSVSVATSQFLFHGVFSTWAAQPATVTGSGHLHGHMQMLLVFTPMSPYLSADSGMWLAHAIAAVATIAALRHGEAALNGLLAIARLWIGSVFARSVLTLPASTPRPAAAVERVLPLRELVLLFASLRHRGPPAVGSPALALS
jgi:hypothetical protein